MWESHRNVLSSYGSLRLITLFLIPEQYCTFVRRSNRQHSIQLLAIQLSRFHLKPTSIRNMSSSRNKKQDPSGLKGGAIDWVQGQDDDDLAGSTSIRNMSSSRNKKQDPSGLKGGAIDWVQGQDDDDLAGSEEDSWPFPAGALPEVHSKPAPHSFRRHPPSSTNNDNRLQKSQYGGVDAAKRWMDKFVEIITRKGGCELKHSVVDPCVFYKRDANDELAVLLTLHVDDGYIARRPEEVKKTLDWV